MLGASFTLAGEKAPDLRESTTKVGFHSVLQGSLTEDSPTYDRAFGREISSDCDAPFSDSANDGVYLEFFCVKSTDANPIELVVVSAGTNIIDTVLTLYCQDFDPSNPLGNGVAYDDDGGEGTMSAITREDGVVLTPGRVYWAVLSTYGASMTGSFLIQASPNLVTCDAVPAAASSWGTLKAIYR
jgi:hypothetical protein